IAAPAASRESGAGGIRYARGVRRHGLTGVRATGCGLAVRVDGVDSVSGTLHPLGESESGCQASCARRQTRSASMARSSIPPLVFTFRPIAFVRTPFTETSQIPKGPGAEHTAEDRKSTRLNSSDGY